MRYAIVESGGKQYRAVEGEVIEVDRLPDAAGEKINLQRILLMSDGDRFEVGTPTLDGIEVKALVVDHINGPKVTRFKYSPKKRIRVRGGHRQHYTRLRIEFVGGKGEVREPARAATVSEGGAAEPVAAKDAPKKAATKKAATKKAAPTKAPAKKTTK
jgi:large subunit ribosomal protein L21